MSAGNPLCACVVLIFFHPSVHSIGLALLPLFVPLGALCLAHRSDEPVSGPSAQSPLDRSDPRYWKAGVIYVNPGDSSLVVRKRSGLGWTLNMGHWASWVIIAFLLLIPFLTRLVLGRHGSV